MLATERPERLSEPADPRQRDMMRTGERVFAHRWRSYPSSLRAKVTMARAKRDMGIEGIEEFNGEREEAGISGGLCHSRERSFPLGRQHPRRNNVNAPRLSVAFQPCGPSMKIHAAPTSSASSVRVSAGAETVGRPCRPPSRERNGQRLDAGIPLCECDHADVPVVLGGQNRLRA